jgi:hypothetical protein
MHLAGSWDRKQPKGVCATALALLATIGLGAGLAQDTPGPSLQRQNIQVRAQLGLRVVDHSGAGIKNADISLDAKDGKTHYFDITGLDGRALVPVLSTGTFLLRIGHQEFVPYSREIDIIQGKAKSLRVVLKRAQLTLTVFDRAGAMMPAAGVHLVDKAGQRRLVETTGGNGTAYISGLPTGAFVLQIEMPGFETYKADISINQGQTKSLSVVLKEVVPGFDDHAVPPIETASPILDPVISLYPLQPKKKKNKKR